MQLLSQHAQVTCCCAVLLQGLGLTDKDKAALKLVWDRVKVKTQHLTQQYELLQSRMQELHMQQVVQNRDFEQSLQELPALLHAIQVAERSRQEDKQQQQQQQSQLPLQQLQQQRQCSTQQQPCPDVQQHAGPASSVPDAVDMQAAAEAVADQLISELKSQMAHNQQLEAQVQVLLQHHLGTTPAHAVNASAAAAGGLNSSSQPHGAQHTQQQQHSTVSTQPSGCVGSSMGCMADPPAAAAAAEAGGQMPGPALTADQQPGISGLPPPGASHVPVAAAVPDKSNFTGVTAPMGMQSRLCEAEEALLQVRDHQGTG
jgi:hypothetical protein